MSDIRQNEQDIERLLAAAGQRRNPPDEMRERVYASALEAWQELPQGQIEQSPRRRVWHGQRYLALAASTLVAVALGMVWFAQSADPASTVADIIYVQGDYRLDGVAAASTRSSIKPDSNLHTTVGSVVSLRLSSGAMLTIDENTQLSITGPDTLFLSQGRLYADASGPGQNLVVQTRYAQIVDIGTQFEVSVAAQSDELVVAVREGQVDVSGAGDGFSAVAATGMGEVVHMRGATVYQRLVVPTTDGRWDWRRAGREPYVLNDSTVYDYLNWMARDTGHELRFSSRAVEQMTKIGILQGKGRTSDDTEITEALAATRFFLHEPSSGQWMVEFRS